jgi:GDP-D-mannose 3',5'-epimerase
MKKVLVTGGGGFLGSNLVKYLSENTEHEISSVGRSRDLKRNLFYREIYFDCDLTNYDACLYFTRGIDWVFDFAAIAGNYKFLLDNAAEIMFKNIQMNTNILEASRINGVKKILFASSSAIYPAIAYIFKEEDAYPLNPENRFYGLEKAYMENLYYLYGKKYGIKIYLPRIQINYGPFIPYTGVKSKSFAEICKRLIDIKNNETLELYGDGTQLRDMIYSEDCAEGLYKLINSDIHEPINISTGKGISINTLVTIATKYLNKKIKITYNIQKDMGAHIKISDNTKIKNLLNWEPLTIHEVGVRKMINWIREDMKI